MVAFRFALLASALALFSVVHAEPVGTSFTYQGELQQQGNPANGTFDFQFDLYDVSTDGNPVSSTVLIDDAVVVDGVFTVELDFGSAALGGDQLWLEIAVRDGVSEGEFTTLSPRQIITAAPFALRALEGTIEQFACSDGQIIIYNGSAGAWGCGELSASIPDGSITIQQIDTASVQARVTGACSIGSVVRAINANGSVVCELDADTTLSEAQVDAFTANNGYSTGPHTVDTDTTYSAGSGLELSGNTFGVANNGIGASKIISNEVQKRITGTCSSGFYLRGINEDGTVLCNPTYGIQVISTVDYSSNTVGEYSSIAIGSDGLPIVSYLDRTAGSLKVAKCNDTACFGGDELITTVDDSVPLVGQFTSIAIGVDGLPVISYQNGTDGTLKVAKCNDLACSGTNESIVTVDDSSNVVGWYSSIAISLDGFPIISYIDKTANTLKVAKCNDLACVGNDELISVVDNAISGGLEYTSISLAPDGLPIITYHNYSSGTLQVAKCNDPACTGGDELISVVDNTSDDVGETPSITIGNDGLPVISYHDRTNLKLKVAKCNDAACSGSDETLTTLNDTALHTGLFTSINIGTDGLPIISYWEYIEATSSGRLKVAKCNDASCSGSDEQITVVDDTANNVGKFSSITIGVDGLPVISYLNEINGNLAGNLRVLRCGNQHCSGQ